MKNEGRINDELLTGVNGGASAVNTEDRKLEFEKAWNARMATLKDEEISGMTRAGLYTDWVKSGYSKDADTFLKSRL